MESIISYARSRKRHGEKVVLTNGCFSLLHAGHIATFYSASELGEVLIVVINSVESVLHIKGQRAIISDFDRGCMISSLRPVTFAIVTDDDTPLPLIERIRPDVLCKGGSTQLIAGQEQVLAYGGEVVRLPLVKGISSTYGCLTP